MTLETGFYVGVPEFPRVTWCDLMFALEMVVGLGCMRVSFSESRLVIGQGFVTRFVCLLGCESGISCASVTVGCDGKP